MSTNFKEKDQTVICQTSVWLAVTRGDKEKHRKKIYTILKENFKEQNIVQVKKKPEFILEEINWLGHETIEQKIKTNNKN